MTASSAAAPDGGSGGPAAAKPKAGSVRPSPRPSGLRRAPLTFRIAMALFFVGGLALLAAAIMFASGAREHIPTWLYLAIALAPIGLIVGTFSIRRAGLSLR
ncbi:hypothetical protein [Nakamurella aerolata]|uniref:Uncharacterized protein n=1 Tax=Nakamurella aerolata TaxID=1656892 RepID=A0A849A496_9ACTN|nr:hypothetical protein [Nakamurella aerolata]NNG35375.1 hypothetical protein [Nakamurella aerolata]